MAATTATLVLASARPATRSGDPLDLVLAAVDTTVTPQAWRRTHPTDSLASDGPTWLLPRVQACRTASGTMTVGGVSVGHLAVFVAPDAPADFALPSDTTLLAARHCLLQSIWIQISAPDVNRAAQMADSIAGMIAQRVGPRLEKARGDSIARKEGDPWSRAMWQRGNAVTVVGRVPEYGRKPAAGDTILWAAAAGTFPSGAGYKHDALNAEYEWSAPDRNPNGGLALDSALAEADVPQAIALEAELRRRERGGESAEQISDSITLPALRALVAPNADLAPARRAAALLAANLLVGRVAEGLAHAPPANSRNRSARQLAFEAVGARYDVFSFDGDYGFLDTWLEAAYRADPTSPAGRIAFRRLLAAGGVPLMGCTGDGTNFNRVIALGDEALRENFPDSGLVHRELALAYADRAAPDPIPGKLSPSQRIVPRQLAIEHARAAIALERDPIARAAMWTLVFREMAGIPVPLRFYCEGD